MVITRLPTVNTVANLMLMGLLMIPFCGSAEAMPIDVQTQVRYDFLSVKDRDVEARGSGFLSTNYSIAFRRPIIPSSTLMSNLTLNSSETSDRIGRQSNKNWEFNVFSNQSKYTLIGRVSSNYTASRSGLEPWTGKTTNYNTSLFLNEAAWPKVNVQYLRNTTASSFRGSLNDYTTNTWLMSSYYDLAPFRFAYDGTRQTLDFPGATSSGFQTRRSSIIFNHALFQGLTLSGEIARDLTQNEYPGGRLSTTTGRQAFRMSMTPTPAIVASVDYSLGSNEQTGSIGSLGTKTRTLGFNMRSQIMPGLAMDFLQQRQSQGGDQYAGTTSTNRSLGLSAQLDRSTFFSASALHADYASGANEGNATDTLQFGLQTSLTQKTDLNMSYGQNKSIIPGQSKYRGTTAGISIRERTSDKVSIGGAYRWNKTTTLLPGGNSLDLTNHAIDADLLWLPTSDLGLNLRLSYQANNGSTISELLTPSMNVRWQIAPSSNLTLNYTSVRNDQWDWSAWSLTGERSRGLSFRLTHSFSDNSSVDVVYDFHGSNIGQREWEKQLRAYFTARL